MELLKKFYECICCIQNPVFPNPYQFEFSPNNPPARNKIEFESNFVKTSKYSWYDFLIKALLLQFKRLANIYFLIISIILTIPEISPLSPVSSWTPLIFVLSISILREGYEDYQRHVSDTKMNHESKTLVLRDDKFIEVEWSKVAIGDIVKVQSQDFFPVDMILLSSTNEGGIAFIETASLDGEKNLKPRNAYNETNVYLDENLLQNIEGEWFGTLPDKQLHKFSSKMQIRGMKDPLIFEGDKQLLYRGARLKNTRFVIGLSIYTGKNTKIMINSESSSVKMSQIEDKVNYILAIILGFQVILSIITAILHGIFRGKHEAQFYYIDWSKYSNAIDSVLMFFVYFVLINTMIPISLIVSIQVVKMCQSYFILKDQLMYSRFRNKYVEVKSSALNQELGQIEYVFSDKTGTLTMNLMEFKIACIGQNMFGDLALISKDPKARPQTEKGFHDERLTKLINSGEDNGQLQKPITVTNKDGGNALTFNSKKQLAEQYLQLLGLTHECVVETVKGKVVYQGPSPDEIALVDAAKMMGFEFVKSTKQQTTIKIRGQLKTVQLLQVFPFNSDRKRMSVVIKEKGVMKLYTKGADSIVKGRLSPKSQLNLDAQLTQFSKIGLRTLLIGMRTVSQQQYQSFRQKINDLPAQNRTEKYNEIVNQLEKGFYLIGSTAVLDRLQDDVPETIRDLIRANIKVWMLTGDKMETAENIAISCKLIQDDFKIFRYQGSEKEHQIADRLSKFIEQAKILKTMYKPKALLIEGSDLTPILKSDNGRTLLAQLAKYCQAVVCCRLLPLQKAEVVALVREKLNKITLAIGDGANDVPMIKTAHIGIGLFGQQGMGAVQSSDYALPEFRMLWRLLLVHGRWNYIRISEMILYFFYKNMIFTIPQYLFGFFCGYSGQTLYDDFYITLYNLLFTSLPLVVRAILEQDINFVVKKSQKSIQMKTQAAHEQTHSQIGIIRQSKPTQILKQQQYLPNNLQINKFLYRLFPKVYFIGQQNAIFNYTNYFLWLAEGILEAIMIFLFCIYSIDSGMLNEKGYSSDMWIIGITTFSAAIVIVTFKLSTHTKFWSVFLFIAVSFLSLFIYLAYMWISNFKLSEHVIGTSYVAWSTAECYFLVLICLIFVLAVDGVVLAIDYHHGGYISKIREKIDEERIENDSEFTNTLAITETLTEKKP